METPTTESLVKSYGISTNSACEIVSTVKSIKKYQDIEKKMDMYHDCIVLFDEDGDITHLLLRNKKEKKKQKKKEDEYELRLISPDTWNDDKGETIMWASSYKDIRSMAYDYLECLREMNDNHSLGEMSLEIYKVDAKGNGHYVEDIYISIHSDDNDY